MLEFKVFVVLVLFVGVFGWVFICDEIFDVVWGYCNIMLGVLNWVMILLWYVFGEDV